MDTGRCAASKNVVHNLLPRPVALVHILRRARALASQQLNPPITLFGRGDFGHGDQMAVLIPKIVHPSQLIPLFAEEMRDGVVEVKDVFEAVVPHVHGIGGLGVGSKHRAVLLVGEDPGVVPAAVAHDREDEFFDEGAEVHIATATELAGDGGLERIGVIPAVAELEIEVIILLAGKLSGLFFVLLQFGDLAVLECADIGSLGGRRGVRIAVGVEAGVQLGDEGGDRTVRVFIVFGDNTLGKSVKA